MAAVLIVLGGFAIYGGRFGQANVQERLEPQNITLPPAEVLSAEEAEAVGAYAGQAVDTGPEALAFANYIGVHLEEVNEGATYSETSAAAREEGIAPEVAAELQGKADTLFKGEALRSILLNAYGWWTVATIAVFAGFAMIAGGIVLAILAALGFRHARRGMEPATEVARIDGRALETA
jgi:hypothetical protein